MSCCSALAARPRVLHRTGFPAPVRALSCAWESGGRTRRPKKRRSWESKRELGLGWRRVDWGFWVGWCETTWGGREPETWRRQKTAHMNCWTDRIFFVALWSLDLGEIVAPIYRNTSCIFFQHLLLVYMSKIWKEPLWGSTCRRGVGGSSPPCPPHRDRV
jgi:hypothetical protein